MSSDGTEAVWVGGVLALGLSAIVWAILALIAAIVMVVL